MTIQEINSNADRYLKIVRWAERRYTINGRLVLRVGGIPTVFTRIEMAAWQRYMA